jgi:hypothetical protein
MKYRLFTNDRRSIRGVPMYSALKDVEAASPEAAQKKCPPEFDEPNCAPCVAIPWPPAVQTDTEKAWLSKHVGLGL